ncbi:unnamed protein product [Brugia timori]|uniref:G_PROTEIN_RECEP_F1_2 domain-containing protein n=1 Tax=Brugia timori TaxID=42155 RepID=A0A0R3R1H0_9BILA|nr:unnamed protein product [Brugia timori]
MRVHTYIQTYTYHFRNATAINSRQLPTASKKQLLHQSSNNNIVHPVGKETTAITNTVATADINTSIIPLVPKRRLVMLLKYFLQSLAFIIYNKLILFISELSSKVSSAMERESTAPCVSPEISDPDAEQQTPFSAAHRIPFIDIDSLTSLVGHDDVYEIPPRIEVIEEPKHILVTSEEVRRPLLTAAQVTPRKHSLQGIYNIINVVRKRSLGRLKKQQCKNEYKSKSENRARKALRTITFILGTFTILWTPFYVLATVMGFCDSCKNSKIFNFFYSISYFLCYMNSPINPFCYAMANQQFKKTLIRILSCDFKRS